MNGDPSRPDPVLCKPACIDVQGSVPDRTIVGFGALGGTAYVRVIASVLVVFAS